MIAIAHLTQPYFSVGWPDLTDQGKPALVMLFLLSGLVIRYVTELRRGRMTDFWVDRISRVYSVVVPALLFTIVSSYIALRVNPAFYLPNWGMNHDRPVLRIFMNLIFMAQSWNLTLDPFSNQPFWTLSYEVFYYVFYAVGFYLAGLRRALWLVVVAILAGQHILLLLPLWLIGCLAQDIYQRVRNAKISKTQLSVRFLAVGVVAGMLLPLSVHLLLYLKGFVTRFFWAHHHAPVNLHWAYIYYAEGIPIVFLLLWGMLLLDRVQLADKAHWVQWVRLLSEATFPLYLLHFPLYVLIVSIFPNERGNPWFKAGMLLTCIALSALLARPTVQFKNYLRDLLRKYIFHKPLIAAEPRLETAK
ncbi:MAG: acyltransferase [Acidobacteriaceae bacterium]|nr:acyltransferase [Acidobacteriaceae bacterium]